MDGRMPRDTEVLHQVISTHGLSVTQVANRSGLAEKSIYKYLAGDRTLPSDVIRAVFELTADLRLVVLITGAVPVQIQALESTRDCPHDDRSRQAPVHVPPPEEALSHMLAAAKGCIQCGEHLNGIFADGRVDRHDLSAIDKLMECLSKVRIEAAVCHASMESAREKVSR